MNGKNQIIFRFVSYFLTCCIIVLCLTVVQRCPANKKCPANDLSRKKIINSRVKILADFFYGCMYSFTKKEFCFTKEKPQFFLLYLEISRTNWR